MTVEEKVQSILAAHSAVTTLCPASRITVPGAWQNIQRPYIVHFPVSQSVTHTHTDGLIAMRVWDYYQVSCIAASYSGARTLANAVVTALDGHHDDLTALFQSEFSFSEPDTDSQQIAINFRIAFAQS